MKKIAVVMLMVLVGVKSYSQKFAKDWSELEDKKFFKKELITYGDQHIKKFVKSNDNLPVFNHLGLMSFSLFQPNYSKNAKYAIITPYLTSNGSEFFIDKIYSKALPEIKRQIQELSKSILTPEEFCKTKQQRELYFESNFEASKLSNAVISISERIRGAVNDAKACPDGYRFILMSNADPKIWRAIGEFAGLVDLDAVLVFETTVAFDGKSLSVVKITASLIGPNPIPYNEKNKKKYAPMGPLKGYLEGILFGSIELTPPKNPIWLANFKKGQIKESSFEGLEVVYARLAVHLLNEVQSRFDKLKK